MKNIYPKIFSLLLLAGMLSANVSFGQAFTHKLEVPTLLDSRHDTLYVEVETHDFGLPGLEAVETMAFTHPGDSTVNTYLGPTLTWSKGDTQRTYVQNLLPSTAGQLKVNQSTVHWHGANIPAWTDGGPHQFFYPVSSGLLPNTFTPKFNVLDNPCTLWYHPHAEDVTYTQVQMGLAGIIRVEEAGDPVDAVAPHTYNVDDFPLIIQDIYFKQTISGGDTTYSIDTLKSGNPASTPRTIVTNGTVQPYMEVPPQPVRFRMLNGSTRNSYMLSFVTDSSAAGRNTSKVPMGLFTSDGGYLPDSVRWVDSLETSPGIRNGVLLDFSSYAGQTLYLVNIYQDLRAGVVGSDSVSNPGNPPPALVGRHPIKNVILQIRVGNTPVTPVGAIPTSLPAIPTQPTPSLTRIINLTGQSGGSGTTAFAIDNAQYDFDVINTVVAANSTELWTIANHTDIAHPFHQHLVQFFVEKVESTSGTLLGEYNNPSLPLPVEYLGPKDDIMVHPGEQVTYNVTFDTYSQPKPFNLDSSAYMYHCHILTHEDGYYNPNWQTISGRSPWGMMQQFAVWDGTVRTVALDEALSEDMILFPNPAEDIVYLNGECAVLSNVCVYDLQGRLLLEKLLPPFQGTTPIDVSKLNSGMVIVKWSTPQDQFVRKVVLE